MEIGKIIAKLRRERGITQEQLGKALGISSQAVSKWENGGSPDVDMLPAIADNLGVTIDTLYGRANESKKDMRITLLNWLASFPQEKRMYELFSLLCCTFNRPYYVDGERMSDLGEIIKLPIKSCYSAGIEKDNVPLWGKSAIASNTGLQMAIPSEDCPVFMILPEPECGYEEHFCSNEEYRTLFSTLAIKGTLEVLRALYSMKKSYRSLKVIAKAAGVKPEETQKALSALIECNVIRMTEVELENEKIETYSLNEKIAFVPFMLISRWMYEDSDYFICSWNDRKKPLLKKKESGKDEKK